MEDTTINTNKGKITFLNEIDYNEIECSKEEIIKALENDELVGETEEEGAGSFNKTFSIFLFN